MRTDQDVQRREREAEKARPLEAGGFAEPRSWMARTKDEIASWFGDTSAMRRRQWDEAAGDHSGQGPIRDVDDDTRIVDELNHRLTLDRMLDASHIRASAREGVVTLDGTVATLASAQHAEGVALAISGVRQVANNLVVA
jgi:osmotically-inducible protein OsmY